MTDNDLTLAACLYPLLLERAALSDPQMVTYGDLVQLARERYPNIPVVHTLVPVSVGRRLAVVREFLDRKGLPDITSLVVNKGTGEVGLAYHTDPEAMRARVAATDWSEVTRQFDLHIGQLRNS